MEKIPVVYNKSEQCSCGASVVAEGGEQEVLEVCREFRARHRHKEEDSMVSKEIGSLTIPVYAGEPRRTDTQYAISVRLWPHSSKWRPLKRLGFESWLICNDDDDDDAPTVFDDLDEAKKASRAVELVYKQLGLQVETVVMMRNIRTYIDAWQTIC